MTNTLTPEQEKEKVIGNVDIKTYHAIHHWLKVNYGRAVKCEGQACSGWSNHYQWALRKGLPYEFKRENFQQLCVSCHTKIDSTEEGRQRMSELHKGKPFAPPRDIICVRCGEKVFKVHSARKYCVSCSKRVRLDIKNAYKKEWEKRNKEKVREKNKMAYVRRKQTTRVSQ